MKETTNMTHFNDINTGFKKIDNILGPLTNGNLYIIGGRPSMGKTSFVTNIATYNTFKENNHVLFFSLQYIKKNFDERWISSLCGVPIDGFKIGFSNKEFETVNSKGKEIPESKSENLIIDDTSITIESIKKRSLSEQNVKLIIIDYLQLMESEKSFTDRRSELDYILRKLKQLAKKMDIPIIIVSTLTRECENRVNKRPMLTDLRDTGSIEDIADVVMFVYRDEYYYKNTELEDKNIAEIIIAKNSMGRVGTIKLAWLDKYLIFGNIEE